MFSKLFSHVFSSRIDDVAGAALRKIFCCEAVAQIFCDQLGLVIVVIIFVILVIIFIFVVVKVWNCAHDNLPVIMYIVQKRLDWVKN